MRSHLVEIALVLLLSSLVMAQQVLDNDSIVKMTKAGLGEDLIVSMVQNRPGHYDLTPDTLVNLKAGGVSEKVLSAMIAKGPILATSPAPQQSPSAATESGPAGDTPESSAPKTDQAPHPEGRAVANGRIEPGARVVIAPMGGFETYFAAAVRNKGVPITLTLDKQSARYFVVSTETEWQGFVYGSGGAASWSPSGGSAAHGSAASSTRGVEASIMLIDAGSKDVVWAYEVHKNSHGSLLFGTHAMRGQQSLAEACAKHLKEFIETGK